MWRKSGQVRVLAKFSAGGADFGYIAREADRGRAVPLREQRRRVRPDNSLEVNQVRCRSAVVRTSASDPSFGITWLTGPTDQTLPSR